MAEPYANRPSIANRFPDSHRHKKCGKHNFLTNLELTAIIRTRPETPADGTERATPAGDDMDNLKPESACGPMRERYWEEKTDAERIQTLGEAVENLSRVVVDQSEQIEVLRMHSHAPDGSLVAKLDATHPRQPTLGYNFKHSQPNPLRRERR